MVSTSAPGEELTNGLVFCQVRSRLTGNRLISIPFSDHCEPLVNNDCQMQDLVGAILSRCVRPFTSIELRPRSPSQRYQEVLGGELPAREFWFHELDLQPTVTDLFKRCHRSVQRYVQRARHNELVCLQGRSRELVDMFYRLQLKARRRQGIPPQPRQWFVTLVDELGDRARIHIGIYQDRPVAGIFTVRHRDTLYYKYAASDARFHKVGAMQFVLWNVIQSAKEEGYRRVDFGRSDIDAVGLVTFKDHWGTTRSRLKYYRYPAHYEFKYANSKKGPVNTFFRHMPQFVLERAGRLLYRHLG